MIHLDWLWNHCLPPSYSPMRTAAGAGGAAESSCSAPWPVSGSILLLHLVPGMLKPKLSGGFEQHSVKRRRPR